MVFASWWENGMNLIMIWLGKASHAQIIGRYAWQGKFMSPSSNPSISINCDTNKMIQSSNCSLHIQLKLSFEFQIQLSLVLRGRVL